MLASIAVAAAVSFAGAALAQNDPNAKIDKPPLQSSLDYVIDGLMENLPARGYSLNQWSNDYIPQECKTIVTGGVVSSVSFSATDVTVFDVTYDDCDAAWTFCHHNSAPIDIDTMASTFGRLPIQMREYVRHVVTLPDPGAWAFEWDGSVTFLGNVPNLLSVVIHETGHALDLGGAYTDKPLSSSDKWFSELAQDADVPDNYAGTNAIEDVAQNTVVAAFDVNVPNGFGTIEPNYNVIFHQFATVITEARDSGKGNSILLNGENTACTHRLPASDPVPKSNSFRRSAADGPVPNVSLPAHISIIDYSVRVHKDSGCRLGRD